MPPRVVLLIFFLFAAVQPAPIQPPAATVQLFSHLHRIAAANSSVLSPVCRTKVLHMANKFIQDEANIALLLNTGKNLNDLGNFHDCTKTGTNRYILLSVNDLPLPVNLGICGPQECAAADYAVLKKPIADLINTLIQSVMPPDMEISVSISPESIEFIDSAEENAIPVSFASVLTLMVIGAFVLAGILAAVLRGNLGGAADPQRVLGKVLRCFDVVKNADALCATEGRHDPNLNVFDGIRVICMLWIVLGHSLMISEVMPIDNPEETLDYLSQFSKAHLYNATLSVDVFFFLSGFMVCFVLLGSIATRLSWKLYLHRLIRLYPTMIVSYVAYCYILPLFADGPRFYHLKREVNHECPALAPYIFSFMYSFKPTDYNCVGWVWYIANDMQFFVIAPPVIYLLYKYPRAGIATILLVLAGTSVATCVVASAKDISSSVNRYNVAYSDYYYPMPYSRIQPYLIGILCAYWYIDSKRNNKVESGGSFVEVKTLSRRFAEFLGKTLWARLVCYVAGAAGCFGLIHAQYWINKYVKDYPRWVDLLYLVGGRSAFVIAVFLLCLPALVGKGRLLKALLANNMMGILSKLTYGVYMMHQVALEYYIVSQHVSSHTSYDRVWFWFCSLATIGYISAVFLFVFIEMPIFSLEDTFLRSRGRRPLAAAKGESTTATGRPTDSDESSPLAASKQ